MEGLENEGKTGERESRATVRPLDRLEFTPTLFLVELSYTRHSLGVPGQSWLRLIRGGLSLIGLKMQVLTPPNYASLFGFFPLRP